MMIYSAGILGGGFANSFDTMIFARIAQGVGISMFPIAFGIVRDIFPIKKLAIALSVTVILFLMGVSYIEEIAQGNMNSLAFFAGSAASLLVFTLVEKRTSHPLIDFKVLANKILLPTNVVLMIVGVSTFMVYQTIPILVQSPRPLGFGGDAISTANVQLPFMII